VARLDLPALKKRLEDGRPAPVHLFVGEDVKLVDRMVDAVENLVDPADRAFAVERIYAGEAGGSPIEIADAARVLPMLGDRRIVIVLRAERLLKPKRARNASSDGEEDDDDAEGQAAVDAGALEAYLDAPVETTTLLFVAAEIDRTRRLTKRLIDRAQVTEFAGATDASGRWDARAAAEWLQQELVREGRKIEREAAQQLVARCGEDITRLRGDVERLLLFVGSRKLITSDDVLEVVVEQSAVSDEWAIVNAIADGDAARALVEAGRRLDRGDSVHQVLGQLRWWVSTRLAPVEPARVRTALEALLRTDLALKSSGGDERVLLERLVVELTGRPLAPARRGWAGRR
jgi:DNA polymerase-3 subunit delta